MSAPTPRPQRAVLLIHGVSSFSEAKARKAVEKAAGQWFEDGSEAHFFNWDRRAGSPRGLMRVLKRWLEETGLGLLVAAHLGLHSGHWRSGEATDAPARPYLWWSICLIPFLLLLSPFFFLAPLAAWLLVGGFALTHLGAAFLDLAAGLGSPIAIARRHLLVLLWPLVHLLSLYGLMELLLGVLIFGLLIVSQDGGDGTMPFLSIGAILLGAAILSLVTSPLFKILGDIFRWIGLPGYRSGLRSALLQEYREIKVRKARELWIVGHSLGSILAVDALLRPKISLGGYERVVLVTLGSPLRRFFLGAFPGVFPSLERIRETIESKTRSFQWINVYRPLDPIGTKIAGAEGAPINVSTGQARFLLGLMPAHTGYWGDSKVLAAILEGLERAGEAEPASAEEASGKALHLPGLEPRESAEEMGLGLQRRREAANAFQIAWYSGVCLSVIGVGTVVTGQFSFGSLIVIPILVAVVTIFWVSITAPLESWLGLRLSPLRSWTETLFCLDVDQGIFEGAVSPAQRDP